VNAPENSQIPKDSVVIGNHKKKTIMNWKDYEIEILDYFTSQFPNAEIQHNVFIKGRYSKVQRQIDTFFVQVCTHWIVQV